MTSRDGYRESDAWLGSCERNKRGHHPDSDNERTHTLDNKLEPQDGINNKGLSTHIERRRNHVYAGAFNVINP
jgi:hypothetical protein